MPNNKITKGTFLSLGDIIPDYEQRFEPGDAIVVSRWIGLYGTANIAATGEEYIKDALPQSIIDAAKKFTSYFIDESEFQIAFGAGAKIVGQVDEAGIFAALWNLGERVDMGLEVSLERIPIRQETIEICEVLDLNPYLLLSGGAMIAVVTNGALLADRFEEVGIPATVIGYLNDTKAKTVKSGDKVRYLNPPEEDEIYKVLQVEPEK
ncbi:MAG: hypothetical protein K5639_02430 [Eubacterium sp.]|nr:hypothetical protein [Eubacterium sp.]